MLPIQYFEINLIFIYCSSFEQVQTSFVVLSEIADSVESSFQGVNDFFDVEVIRAQITSQYNLLGVSELEQEIRGFKTRMQENAVKIRNKQEEYEIYSKQIRSLEIQMR